MGCRCCEIKTQSDHVPTGRRRRTCGVCCRQVVDDTLEATFLACSRSSSSLHSQGIKHASFHALDRPCPCSLALHPFLPAQGLMSASIDDSTRGMLRMGAQGVQRCCGPRNRSFPPLPLH
jgi:hypothetical protein